MQSLCFLPAICLALFLSLLPQAQAFAVFSESTDLSGVTAGCADALKLDLTCSSAAFSFQYNSHYPRSMLELACTPSCQSSLMAWSNSVERACAGAHYEDENAETQPIASLSGRYLFLYQNACRTDGHLFCNVLEPNSSQAFGASDCSKCIRDKLRDVGETDYYDGPFIRSQSLYQSYTSSCGYSGKPLSAPTGSPTSARTPMVPALSASTPKNCKGHQYVIKPGDTCQSISLSQGIGTTWLLIDNDLPAYCASFPTQGKLCLENICKVYTVQKGDTCSSIAKAHKITETQLRAWNPVINTGCFNLDKSVAAQLCVDEPGQDKYHVPSVTYSGYLTTATSAASVPNNVAMNTTRTCGRFHAASKGEYCNLLTIKYGLSLRDFRFLNGAINENCTNLFAGESYCVQAVGDINTYSGRPGYMPTGPRASRVAYTSLPDATYVPVLGNFQGSLACDTLTGCSQYALGSSLIFNQSFISDCEVAASIYDISLQDLAAWNPSLKDVKATDCSFEAGSRYCMELPRTASPTFSASSQIATTRKKGLSSTLSGFHALPTSKQASPRPGVSIAEGGDIKTVVSTVVHLTTAVVYATVMETAHV